MRARLVASCLAAASLLASCAIEAVRNWKSLTASTPVHPRAAAGPRVQRVRLASVRVS